MKGVRYAPIMVNSRDEPMTGATLIAARVEFRPAAPLLTISSEATGVDVVANIIQEQGAAVTSVVMKGGGPAWRPGRDRGAVESLAKLLAPLPRFEIVFADPLHDHATAGASLTLALEAVTPDGWLVVHDCLGPPWLMTTRQRGIEWVGATSVAFRDVAVASGRPWFVVDADFGLGVLAPKDAELRVHDDPSLERRWRRRSPSGRLRLARRHGDILMRSIERRHVIPLLTALEAGEAFTLPTRRPAALRRIRRQRRLLGIHRLPMRVTSRALYMAYRYEERLGTYGPRLLPRLRRWRRRYDRSVLVSHSDA